MRKQSNSRNICRAGLAPPVLGSPNREIVVSSPGERAVPCPVCDAPVGVAVGAVQSELVRCRGCGSELELVRVDPPEYREAPMEEEDWGE